jgi:hypothetical protein
MTPYCRFQTFLTHSKYVFMSRALLLLNITLAGEVSYCDEMPSFLYLDNRRFLTNKLINKKWQSLLTDAVNY